MQVAFGAWGLGGLIAARSPVWRRRFGGDAANGFTIPPMSSLHPGSIELFPFLLSECIFIDAIQYELLTSETGRALLASAGYRIDSKLGDLLRDFARSNVLRPVDYSSLIKPHLDDLARLAETTLDTPGLAVAAAWSRDLWRQFLLSPGGESLSYRALELEQLTGHTDPAAYSRMLQVDPKSFGGKETLPEAALLCAHDVFDTTAMLKVGSSLGVTICDWQMYRPMYRHGAKHTQPEPSNPRDGTNGAVLGARNTIDPMTPWYIPTPRSPGVNDVRRMRDDSYVTLLRDEVAELTASRLIDHGDPGTLLDLRKEIHRRVPGVILNSYAHYEATKDQTAFVERLPPGPVRPTGSPVRTPTPFRAAADPRRASATSIFVSYAKADNESANAMDRWLDRLLEHMAPIARQSNVTIFSSMDVAPGEDHRSRIQREIEHASIAILLVSSSYLASEHVYLDEVPNLLWRRHNDGLVVVPLIVTHCLFEESFFMYPDPHSGPQSISLSAFQPANPPARPLTSLTRHEQDYVLLSLAQRVRNTLRGTAT